MAEEGWQTAEELIDGLKGLEGPERDIVRTRWLNEARMYERLWRRQRLAYYWLRTPTVIGATTVPVLASLGTAQTATVLVGLAVAILTALNGLYGLGNRWQQARLAEEALSAEGWRFLELSGEDYGKLEREEAYKTFLWKLEKLNERLSMMRLDLFGEKEGGHQPPKLSSHSSASSM